MIIHNIAAYRFVTLSDPAAWVVPLETRATALGLNGTILVAGEGINLFLAGPGDAVDAFVDWLRTDTTFVDREGRPALSDLVVRRSVSTHAPFGRLRVKHKPEIVTMRNADARPDAGRAASVAPGQLAAWLAQGHDDEGRPIVMLDARNAFEVALGAFDGARHFELTRFDQWPAAVDAMEPLPADVTIVTYCTGGIRCEKAALYLWDRHPGRVLQLEGGILGYFEQVGSAHWHGDCFVFDERISLDPSLEPAERPIPAPATRLR